MSLPAASLAVPSRGRELVRAVRGLAARLTPHAAFKRRGPACGIVGGGFLIALIVAAVSALSIWHLRETQLAYTGEGLQRLDKVLAEQTDRTMQSIDLMLSGLVNDLHADGIESSGDFQARRSGEAVHRLLRDKVRALPQLDAITMISAEGRLINFSRSWPIPGVDVADRDYFKTLRDHPEQRIFISAPVKNRGTGTWTIYLAHRVSDRQGGFVGLVLGAIELHYFSDFYRDVLPGPDSSITLMRRDGVLLARYPAIEEKIGVSFADGPVFTDVLRRGNGGLLRVYSPLDGLRRIVSAEALHNYPLVVNVSQSEAGALANWRTEAWIIAAIGAAAVIAIGLLTASLVKRFAAYELLATARAETHRAITAGARAEALSEARSQFIASVSHELRTPLNAILGFSEILQTEVFGPLGSPRYIGYAGDIHQAGSHLLDLVNDILDLSKAEANALELDRQLVDVADIIRRVVQMLRPQADRGELSLRLEIADDLPRAFADEKRVFQALINLVSNAIKFTPPRGTVLLAAEYRPGALVLRVRDSGIGIAVEDIPLVMQAFGQADSGLARKTNGTGLGLPLTKHFVELHGGEFALESIIGAGTEATITLPMPQALDPTPVKRRRIPAPVA